jgi:hypothetical protein
MILKSLLFSFLSLFQHEMCQIALPLLLFLLLLLLPLTRLHHLLHHQLHLHRRLHNVLQVLPLLRLMVPLFVLLSYVEQRVADLFDLLFVSVFNRCHLWRGVL